MAIVLKTIHGYLAHPGKNESKQQKIKVTTVSLAGELFEMISRVS